MTASARISAPSASHYAVFSAVKESESQQRPHVTAENQCVRLGLSRKNNSTSADYVSTDATNGLVGQNAPRVACADKGSQGDTGPSE